mgnify:CR=1 FL=1
MEKDYTKYIFIVIILIFTIVAGAIFIFRNANNRYAKAVRRAHKMHHKHIGKEEGECFGMLLVPFKYFKK